MTKKITVAIPAFNEENNIEETIKSVLSQKLVGYNLIEVFVYSDGSTDKTNSIVKRISKKNPKVRLKSDGKRLGKVKRLNQIYSNFVGDILVIYDADIIIPSETTQKLVDNFDKNSSLVVAHQIPLRGNTFISKSIHAGYEFWDSARLSVNNGDHIQNFYGAASAYSKKFAKSLKIPDAITDERGYIYLKAKQFGKFTYVFDAPIYYWPVRTLKDFFKLADRSFEKNEKLLKKQFQNIDIDAEYFIPLKFKISGILKSLFHRPIFTVFGISLNIATRLFKNHDNLYDKGLWETSTSTKTKLPRDKYEQ